MPLDGLNETIWRQMGSTPDELLLLSDPADNLLLDPCAEQPAVHGFHRKVLCLHLESTFTLDLEFRTKNAVKLNFDRWMGSIRTCWVSSWISSWISGPLSGWMMQPDYPAGNLARYLSIQPDIQQAYLAVYLARPEYRAGHSGWTIRGSVSSLLLFNPLHVER